MHSLTDAQPALPRDGKPYKEEEESRTRDQGTNSALSPTLDAATKLFDMIFFDDRDIEEEEQEDEDSSVPIDADADIFLGIVDSLTLTKCKALDLSSLLDEDVEDIHMNMDTQVAKTTSNGHRRGGVRGVYKDTISIIAVKTKTVDG